MNIAWGFGPPIDRSEAVRLLRRAVDLGLRYFDSAEVYGPNVSEQYVGEALGGVRQGVVIASKFGFKIVDGKIAGLDSRSRPSRTSTRRSLSWAIWWAWVASPTSAGSAKAASLKPLSTTMQTLIAPV